MSACGAQKRLAHAKPRGALDCRWYHCPRVEGTVEAMCPTSPSVPPVLADDDPRAAGPPRPQAGGKGPR
eukprot:10309844-Alexandrium_andersonii.AAC.1